MVSSTIYEFIWKIVENGENNYASSKEYERTWKNGVRSDEERIT